MSAPRLHAGEEYKGPIRVSFASSSETPAPPNQLEVQPQSHLDVAWEIRLAGDLGETPAGGRERRTRKLGMIERIQEIAANLQIPRLPQIEPLHDLDIDHVLSLPPEAGQIIGERAHVVGKIDPRIRPL